MISLHLLADNAEQSRLDRAVLYLRRTNQRTVNIGGGSQLDRAMQLAERVRAEVPGIKVFWRHLEDTGIHAVMSPEQWYNSRVAPRLDWLQKHKIICVLDNESSGDDNQIRRYADWHVTVLQRLHAVGLNGAVCRFATGNIGESQYQLLKPIFDVMQATDYISPNEYSNAPGKSSGGHLERYKRMWDVAKRELPTTIGEAGICVDYDPGKGYRDVPGGMSGKAYAEQMIREEVWYGGGKIDRFLYCIGGHGWESFQIGDDVLETLEAYYQKNPIVVTPPTVPPTPTPPQPLEPALPVDLGAFTELEVKEHGYFVRFVGSPNGKIIGKLRQGETIRLYNEGVSNGGYLWRVVERLGNVLPDEARRGYTAYPMPAKPTEPTKPTSPGFIVYTEDMCQREAAVWTAIKTVAALEEKKWLDRAEALKATAA